ncbi:15971_t:CDS:2 [Funneliformis geosporum]|nr:15971_t:CDS:2 [Funneliformis geosporum]
MNTLPQILEYQPPLSLLKSFGSSWPATQLIHKLRQNISQFYNYYKTNRRDKTNSPLFLALGGAGIGKSRLLTELPRIAQSAVTNLYVKHQLDNCIIFNVSFESGTIYDGNCEKIALQAIGIQMLWQLLRQHESVLDFNQFRQNPAHHLSVSDVLSRISYKGHCLSTIASMVIGHPAFIIACCSATIVEPIVDVLAKSQQLRVLLPFHVLDPPQRDGKNIFNIEHPLIRILVEDMGGNGRALEALEIHIPADIDNCYIGKLMHNIISDIAQLYSDVLDNSSHLWGNFESNFGTYSNTQK